MNEAVIIWLYLALGNIFNLGWIVLLFVFSVCLLVFCALADYSDDEIANVFKEVWKLFPKKAFVLWLFLTLMYPAKDDLKYIIGGAVAWNGIEAAKDVEGIDRLPANLVNAANVFLESIEESKE